VLTLLVASFLIRGVVVDSSGLPVAGARIAVEGSPAFVITSADGRFVLDESPPVVLLVDGVRHAVTDSADVRVVTTPSTFSDEIVVTASRTAQRVAETPASVVVISAAELRHSAAPVLDEVLRQVPGFTLFRRSGSRTANPTTHGATLRGVGASGASRAVVLDDGIPLNDPFGGWVSRGRVPRLSLQRVEILRGDLVCRATVAFVIAFDRIDCGEYFVAGAEREQSAAGRQEFAEAGLLRDDRAPGGEIARAAVAEPAGVRPDVLVARDGELRARAADVIAVLVHVG